MKTEEQSGNGRRNGILWVVGILLAGGIGTIGTLGIKYVTESHDAEMRNSMAFPDMVKRVEALEVEKVRIAVLAAERGKYLDYDAEWKRKIEARLERIEHEQIEQIRRASRISPKGELNVDPAPSSSLTGSR